MIDGEISLHESQVISGESQEHFWHVVRACLREFHNASQTVLDTASELRQKIDVAPIEEVELFFHGEPFNIACGLAGHPLPIEPCLERYLVIRDGGDQCDE